jgi:hypothetical protein
MTERKAGRISVVMSLDPFDMKARVVRCAVWRAKYAPHSVPRVVWPFAIDGVRLGSRLTQHDALKAVLALAHPMLMPPLPGVLTAA